MEQDATFEGWYVVTLTLGDRVAGLVQQVQLLGVPWLRVDLPLPEGRQIQEFYSVDTLRALTACDAEDAEAFATHNLHVLQARGVLGPPEGVRPAFYLNGQRVAQADPPMVALGPGGRLDIAP